MHCNGRCRKQKREQNQFAKLSDQIAGLQKKLEEAKAEASLDGLTGIANRRNFDFTFQRWVVAHDKSEEPFTVALLISTDSSRSTIPMAIKLATRS